MPELTETEETILYLIDNRPDKQIDIGNDAYSNTLFTFNDITRLVEYGIIVKTNTYIYDRTYYKRK